MLDIISRLINKNIKILDKIKKYNFIIRKIINIQVNMKEIRRMKRIIKNNLDSTLNIAMNIKSNIKIIGKIGIIKRENQNYTKMYSHLVSLKEEKIDQYLKKSLNNLII